MRVYIKNFKSLKEVEAELGRLTILVGPPNSGKSNFLEALTLLGYAVKASVEKPLGITDDERIGPLDAYIRLTVCDDLVYEGEPGSEVKVSVGKEEVVFKCGEEGKLALTLRASDKQARVNAPLHYEELKLPAVTSEEAIAWSFFQALIKMMSKKSITIESEPIKPNEVYAPRLYSFDRMGIYEVVLKGLISSKLPPYPHERGINLAWILYSRSTVFNEVNSLVRELAKLNVVTSPKSFDLVKGSRAVPAALASDTVIRCIYYSTALLGNVPTSYDATTIRPIVMLEEPESHLSPLPRKTIVEVVKKSVENGNVLVMSTHDPILAAELYESVKGTKVLYFRMEDDVTKVCEVREFGLFSDLLEEVEVPC